MPGRNHIKFSAADIDRYHRGQMTASEMHALEKAALDDPFLADALEGYAYSKQPAEEISALKKDLQKRIGKKERQSPVFYFNNVLKIAAILLLVAAIGWIAYQLPFRSKTDLATTREPAVKKSGSKPAESIKQSQDTTLETPSSVVSDSIPVNTSASVQIQTNSERHKVNPATASVSHKKIPAVNTPSIAAAKTWKNEDLQGQADVAVAAPQVEKKRQQLNGEQTGVSRVIKGKIRSDNGEPVPYASVIMNGSVRTISDEQGNFAVKAPDSTAIANFVAIGYDKENARISSSDSNVIVLQQDKSALNEVVVSGYKKPSRNSTPRMIVESGELEPAQGWVQYNEYIASRIKPDPSLQGKDRGEVALSFEVNEAGEPVNITVENSECTECNAEAIKLLKEGPKWKVKKGRKGKISFRF